MKTQFDTNKEAQDALDTANCESLGWCPAIKQECRKDCICYYKGDIHYQEPKQYPGSGPTKEYWFVQYPGCTNVLISGIVTIES